MLTSVSPDAYTWNSALPFGPAFLAHCEIDPSSPMVSRSRFLTRTVESCASILCHIPRERLGMLAVAGLANKGDLE